MVRPVLFLPRPPRAAAARSAGVPSMGSPSLRGGVHAGPGVPEDATWVFGYGSLVWRPGFVHRQRLQGYIKGFRRVFYQGSTDHRGVPGAPGRVVTLTKDPSAVTWGAAYELEETRKKEVLEYLEIREKQYDLRVYTDFYTPQSEPEPAVRGVLIYLASDDVTKNTNYLGPAPLDDIARQVARSQGPSGKNSDYIFELHAHFQEIGIPDPELDELARRVRCYCDLSQGEGSNEQVNEDDVKQSISKR